MIHQIQKTQKGSIIPWISRTGQSTKTTVKSQFQENYQERHQKGRRLLINIQDKVEAQLELEQVRSPLTDHSAVQLATSTSLW